ncbi:hypothetical protein OC844_004981 [Tilletia horrida]|nr:hypothetical protein OC844_004981 [Tilletia horrida]
MTLDTACFALHLHARPDAPDIVDLYDASDILAHHAAVSLNPPTNLTAPPPPSANLVALYSHHRALASTVYDVLLTDPRFGDAQLASCTAPSSAERTKTINLHNPETSVVLAKQGGTLAAFNQGEWRVEWEDDLVLRWKKEGGGIGKASYSASIIRSPDPAISVGSYAPATKRMPPIISIYDHNFHRLEISDPRGLEIVMVQTAMILADAEFDEDHRAPGSNPFVSTLVSGGAVAAAAAAFAGGGVGGAASPGQAGGRPGMIPSGSSSSVTAPMAPNEILITPHGTTASYVGAALNLLQPESAGGHGCSLIELKATPGRPDAAQKAVGVAASVKAGWYKLTSTARGSTNAELFQYVRTDDDDKAKDQGKAAGSADDATPRRRIMLNEPTSSSVVVAPLPSDPHASYKPPSTLSIILSKERLPELEPRAKPPMGSSQAANLGTASPPLGWSMSSAVPPMNDGPRRPPKTMSVRRNGRWTPQPVPLQQQQQQQQQSYSPYSSPPPAPGTILSGGVVAAPLPGAGGGADANSSPGRPGQGHGHHGRRLLNKLGFGNGSGGGAST